MGFHQQKGKIYIRLIAQDRYDDAYMVNWKSNVFPGILGRTCDRPCEPACRRGRIEEEIVRYLWWLKPVVEREGGEPKVAVPARPAPKKPAALNYNNPQEQQQSVFAPKPAAPAAPAGSGTRRGKAMVKVEPRPRVLVTVTSVVHGELEASA